MSQSGGEMSSFLAELAGEATQKMEAMRAQQMDKQAIAESVNGALARTFQFLNLFSKHLNAIEPDIPRIYTLDGRAQYTGLKWKGGMAEYRKQSLADNALLDNVFFQAKLMAASPVTYSRRWEQFDEAKKTLRKSGLKTLEDMDELWRKRNPSSTMCQVGLEPEFLIWIRFRGNYADGTIQIESSNLDGFGEMAGNPQAEALQTAVLDELGRFLMGRAMLLPTALQLSRPSL